MISTKLKKIIVKLPIFENPRNLLFSFCLKSLIYSAKQKLYLDRGKNCHKFLSCLIRCEIETNTIVVLSNISRLLDAQRKSCSQRTKNVDLKLMDYMDVDHVLMKMSP